MQRKFLTININECLSLNDKHFADMNLNIDYLSKSLPELEHKQQLVIATKCVNLCEKFHSYFHFEQSYFHLLLGKLQQSSEQYEAAIFQDPLNYEAKHLLNNFQSNSNVTFKDTLYTRDFQNLKQFLEK